MIWTNHLESILRRPTGERPMRYRDTHLWDQKLNKIRAAFNGNLYRQMWRARARYGTATPLDNTDQPD